MKVLLVVGGVLFLLLAIALFIGAVVTFLIARKRGAEPAGRPEPEPVRPPSPPPGQPAPAAVPAEVAVAAGATDLAATVMIDSRRQQAWGSLRATTGALAGRVFPIDPKGFYIGRDRTQSQIVIDSPSVSKRHVWIGVRDGAVVAIDQQSTNGTYLNSLDASITEVKLRPGDTLIVSDDVARFAYNG